MDIEKERLSGHFLMPNWVATEHNFRFLFAAKYTQGKTVVDCACGNGAGTNIFSIGSLTTYGFDVSSVAIREAKENCTQKNVVFQEASGTALPLQDNFADVCVSLETIEHIDADREFLKEVYRVLKPEGVFICSTPNRSVTNPGKQQEDKPANVFHVREYTQDEFVKLLSTYFSGVEIYGQNKNIAMKVSLLNFLGSFLPMNLAVRLHQAFKLVTHIFRSSDYYNLQRVEKGDSYEYVTAVCIK